MTALAAARQTFHSLPGKRTAPQKGSTTIYQGGIVMLDAGGYLIPGATVTGAIGAGVAKTNGGLDRWTNAGADGASDVDYEEGVFGFNNSSAGDAITIADEGKPFYIVDDQTVALTSGSGARSPGGRIHHLDVVSGLVYCEFSANLARQTAEEKIDALDSDTVEIPVVLVAQAEGGIAARFTPGFAGTIKKVAAFVAVPATTAAKAATLTPAIAGVGTTGGAVALTSANCTPAGAKVNGSTVTALNAFAATDEITVVATGVTAFVEGQVVLQLFLNRDL